MHYTRFARTVHSFRSFFVGVYLMMLVGTTNIAHAQGGLQNPLRFDDLGSLLEAILEAVILIAFPVLVLFLVYAGFLFIAAQGNPEKLANARRVFIWALIGALIVLGAQAISLLIGDTVRQLQP